MNRKSIIRVITGFILCFVSTALITYFTDGWHINRWSTIINGIFAVSIIFPPIVRWAKETMGQHRAISKAIIWVLNIWTIMWVIITVSTLLGILK